MFVKWCCAHAHSIMDRRLQRAVVAVLLTLLGTCSPYLYSRQPWSASPSAQVKSNGLVRGSVWTFPIKRERIPVVAKRTSAARMSPYLYAGQLWPAALSAPDRSDELVRESAWSFPYKYERIPVVAMRILETRLSDPCSVEVMQETRQSRRDNCEDAAATPTTTTHLPSHRPLRLGGWWPRPFSDDTRLDFLGVLAVVGVKIIMSTALASWFLVAGQLLFAIADITGSSEIFGNGSPLVFIFQALPLVEMLLRGSSAFS